MKKLLLLSAASAVLSTSAFAGGDSFYLRLNAGATLDSAVTQAVGTGNDFTSSTDLFDTDRVYLNGQLGFGYSVLPNVRVEAVGFYMPTQKVVAKPAITGTAGAALTKAATDAKVAYDAAVIADAAANGITPGSGTTAAPLKVTSDAAAAAVTAFAKVSLESARDIFGGFARVGVDIADLDIVKIFATAGAGMANVTETLTMTTSDGKTFTPATKAAAQNNLAWTVGGGFAVPVSDNLDIELSYNYTSYGSTLDAQVLPAVANLFSAGNPATADVKLTKQDLFAHSALLGIRFSF